MFDPSAITVDGFGAAVEDVGDGATALTVPLQRSGHLVENTQHSTEFDRRLGPRQTDGVMVLQDWAAAVGRGQLDLVVAEDGCRHRDGLSVGGDLDVAIDRELDLDVATPWGDPGDLAHRHAQRGHHVAFV